ncbi:MAG: sugar ABC transporter permease [Anaerolineae bacterium]|nr:sugar ABC transporter permease [Thermoflexales bacterium]MDW8395074.1 sugar ABC transporter permease [Anaerolineae bacterium]
MATLATSPVTTTTPQRTAIRVSRIERVTPSLFILPAVLVVLFISIFPLLLSLFLSLSRLRFGAGGLQVQFVGLDNYRKLLLGSEQKVLFGTLGSPSVVGWALLALVVLGLVWWIAKGFRARRVPIGRILSSVLLAGLSWLVIATLFADEGRPGTLVVTMLYVFVGIALQYLIGLGLALLCAQQLPGRRFFRVVFLLPMMITPVGVGYLFRMLADTNKGPLMPLWTALGLQDFSWANNAWGARIAVMIGDLWQWTPFMFIVLLAALEGQEVEPVEAAIVDGANSWQIFRHITLPAILPVSATLILIRIIEAFKIIDLPNILTNGGPGTATETLTLYAYRIWRALDIGGSAAIAYILLFLVTFIAMFYVRTLRSRLSVT